MPIINFDMDPLPDQDDSRSQIAFIMYGVTNNLGLGNYNEIRTKDDYHYLIAVTQ